MQRDACREQRENVEKVVVGIRRSNSAESLPSSMHRCPASFLAHCLPISPPHPTTAISCSTQTIRQTQELVSKDFFGARDPWTLTGDITRLKPMTIQP